MRYFALLIVSSILGTLLALPAGADRPHALPPPRWHVSLSPLFGTHPEETHVTAAGDVILVSHYPSVVALDRATGRELWRRSEPHADSHQLPRTTTGWRLLSSDRVDGVGQEALLLEIRGITTADRSSPGGERSMAEYCEVALNAASGQELWRSESNAFCTSALFGNLVVDVVDAEAQNQPQMLRYRDAGTGAILTEVSPHGSAAVKSAIQHRGGSCIVGSSSAGMYVAHLVYGTATRLDHGEGCMLGSALYPKDGLMVFYYNSDDGGAGHSTWPKYVECASLTGAKRWTFPKDLQLINADYAAAIPPLYSLLQPTPCRECVTALCVSERVGRNGKFWCYGLDAHDGRVLWKSAIVDEPPVTAECGAGFLVIAYRNTAAGRVDLEWMDGRTGRVTRIGPAPNAAMMAVSGSDLLVVDPGGSLSAFSFETIWPGAAKQRSSSENRHAPKNMRPRAHRNTHPRATDDPEYRYGRDIWTHRIGSSQHYKGCATDIQWSADRRALAIYFCHLNDKNRLLVWRRGKPIRDWNGSSFLAGEPLYKMAWSPDNRRLLIHIPPSEGSWDSHTGPLWCVDMATGKHRLICGSATYFSWRGSNAIRYRYKVYGAPYHPFGYGPEHLRVVRVH